MRDTNSTGESRMFCSAQHDGDERITFGGIMQISKHALGSSGLEITRVGFGAWAIGGGGWAFGWGSQDDEASENAMRRALELGINWIDTAAVYGLGHSEQVVGRFLRSLPASERPFVFTKCGLVWDEGNPMQEPKRVLKPEDRLISRRRQL